MRWIAVLIAFSGCSSSTSSPSGPPQCAEPRGLYHWVYKTVDGNCGPIPEEDTVFGQQHANDPSCAKGPANASDDGCRVSAQLSCVGDATSSGRHSDYVFTFNVSQDGTSITGTESIKASVLDGGLDPERVPACSGSYTFVATKTHD